MKYFEALQPRVHKIVEAAKFVGTSLTISGAAMMAEAKAGSLNLPAEPVTAKMLIATGGLALIGALTIEEGLPRQ